MKRAVCVLLFAAALVIAAAAFSGPATAGQTLPTTMICDTTDALLAVPAAGGGIPVAHGPAGEHGRSLGQLVLSPSGDWAFFVRLPDGYSCVLASGHDWTDVEPVPPPVPPAAHAPGAPM